MEDTDFTRSTLAGQLAELRTNAQSGGNYVITINQDEFLTPVQAELPSGRSNLTITLRGDGAMRTVSLGANGSLFSVDNGVTLVLENNITLRGRTGNDNFLVQVWAGGTLIMNEGARITGNTETGTVNTWGGGVIIFDNGMLTMHGGEISNNSANWGGGVQVQGTFIMHGGTIANNTARTGGGGVHIWGSDTSQGNFTMHNGMISGNTVTGLYAEGGGVRISDGGIFTMHNGIIFDNTAYSNTAGAWGGGVSVRGTFTMHDGEIFDNTATGATWGQGGGVLVNSYCGGLFNMRGGVISGNVVVSNGTNWAHGGGVFVCGYSPAGGTFRMSGGIILSDNIMRHTGNMGSRSALTIGTSGADSAIAQFGTFVGASFSWRGGLTTSHNTVEVINGVLQGSSPGQPVNLDPVVGLSGSGAASFYLLDNDGDVLELLIANRGADWHGLDIQFYQLVDAGILAGSGTYTVYVEGRGGEGSAGLFMLQGLPGWSWGATVALTPNANFVHYREIIMGGDWNTFRLTTNAMAAGTDIIVTSIEVKNIADAVVWSLAEVLMRHLNAR